MTKLSQHSVVCKLCGTTTDFKIVESTYSLASSDLDLRPAEKTRSTLPFQVQQCPKCHYCAPNISSLPRTRAALSIDDQFEESLLEEMYVILHEDRYRQQLKDPDFPPLANRFLCSSLISETLIDYSMAFWDVMRAAWVCDDASAAEAASRCRGEAIALFEGLRRREQRLFSEHGLQELVLVDLYRRMGRLNAAKIMCDRILSSQRQPAADLVINLHFEQHLIKVGDSQAHTFDQAVEHSGTQDLFYEPDPAERAVVEAVLREVEQLWPGLLDAPQNALPGCLYVVQTTNADWDRLLCLPPAARVWLYDHQRQRVPISPRSVPRGFYITGDEFTEGLMGHLGRSWMSTASGPYHPFACFKFHISLRQERVLINYVFGPLRGGGWVGKVVSQPGDAVRLRKDPNLGEWAT